MTVAICSDDLIVLDASDEDTTAAAAAAAAAAQHTQASTPGQAQTSDMEGSSSDDGFEILTPAPATLPAVITSRPFEETLTVAELQAQRIAYERLQKEAAQRSKGRSPVKKEKPQKKAAVPAILNPIPSPPISPKRAGYSNSTSDFSRESSEDRQQRNSSREKRERRAPTSFSDFQAQDQEYSRFAWKKSRGETLPEGYPQQNHGGVQVDSDTARKFTKAPSSKPKKAKRSDSGSSGSSDDDDDDDDGDDDFITEPEKTTDGTSDEDDDFYAPEPKKVKMQSFSDDVKMKSLPDEVKMKSLPNEVNSLAERAAKPGRGAKKQPVEKKKRRRRVVKNRQPSGASGNSSFAAATELVSDILARPRNAEDSVVNTTCWRAVRFDDAPACVLPLPETVDAEFHSAFERPIPTFGTLRLCLL